MILFIFSLQESYQTRGKELFVPNLNYRLQCYFNTDHVFLKTNPDQSLSLNLLPGFFFAFPTQQIINVRKSIKEYTIVQSTFAKFMQTYNLSSLETNFLITGGMQSLKSFDAVSDEYLETEVEIEDNNICVLCNNSSTLPITLKINYEALEKHRIINLMAYVFAFGYSKKINKQQITFQNEDFILPRPISQSCRETNKKMAVQALRYLSKYINSCELIRKMGLRTTSIFKSEDEIMPSDTDNIIDSIGYVDTPLFGDNEITISESEGRISEDDVKDMYEQMILNGEYLKKANIEKIISEDQKWLELHNPRQSNISADHICNITYKNPASIPIKNFTSKNIFHFISFIIKVPESCQFLVNNQDILQCENINNQPYVVSEISIEIKKSVININPFAIILRNEKIRYPLYIHILNNVIRKNLFTEHSSDSVLAVIEKSPSGVLVPIQTNALSFNRSLCQFLFFKILDSNGKHVYINPKCFFSVLLNVI